MHVTTCSIIPTPMGTFLLTINTCNYCNKSYKTGQISNKIYQNI